MPASSSRRFGKRTRTVSTYDTISATPLHARYFRVDECGGVSLFLLLCETVDFCNSLFRQIVL